MTSDTNDDKLYKHSDGLGIRSEIRNDLERNLQKFSDPIVLAEMAYKLLEERENTNRILKNIHARLEELGGIKEAMPGAMEEEPMLPEVDEQIIAYLKRCGKATAEEVRTEFNYKGRNGASARLNRLFLMGLLDKRQAGKKVYFFPK